ncbi:MAG: Uma2 family endonuclease [Pirellulaceae bacterium]
MSIASTLITAAQFGSMPDPGHPQELVRGVVVNRPPPKPRHGQVCGNIYLHVRLFADAHRLGHVVPNDSGVITQRNPDTVRGMDVAFVGYDKVPPGPLPASYFKTPPDAVFEVRSPSDRSPDVLSKVHEYLQLGVPVVYVFNPDTSRVHCYFQDRADEILNATDEFVGIGPLANFRIPAAKFFE